MATKTVPELHHKGSLITYSFMDGDQEACLGDLFCHPEHGVFDPFLGKVDVTAEEAEIHNRCLSEARLKGLDERCEIGQGGTFYLIRGRVVDFIGTLVSDQVVQTPTTITFTRNGKVYRGRKQKDAMCFNFRRVK